MYRLRVLERARKDMRQSAEWYDSQQSGLGEKFLREVVATFRSIQTSPLHYEVKFSKKFRFAQVHVFPFVVIFKIKGDEVVVNSVFHTSRNNRRYI
jgi:plasmid stabilization system protein ParE